MNLNLNLASRLKHILQNSFLNSWENLLNNLILLKGFLSPSELQPFLLPDIMPQILSSGF